MEQKLTIEEFRKLVKKLCGPKHFKFTNSLGLNQVYKLLKHNRWFGSKPTDENLLYLIITTVNKEIAKELANGLSINLPLKMGKLELRKCEAKPKIVDGKLVYRAGIDWGKTIDWWYEDEEARTNKLLIKRKPGIIYMLKWTGGKFINRKFFRFNTMRSLKSTLNKKEEEGTLLAC